VIAVSTPAVPELPEVETVRRGLEERFVGRRIERVEVGRERSVRRTSRDEVIARLTRTTPTAVRRRGKYLIIDLDSGDEMMIHLRMSGQVLIERAESDRPAHTHVILTLRGQPTEELRFVDPRTFGEVVVYDPEMTNAVVPELARLGPDPISEGLELSQLRRSLSSTARAVKAALLDQSLVAGIGNIYGDEILHRARIHPKRPARNVSSSQIRRLHACIHEVLSEAIAAGGSTLGDAQYVDLMGEAGSFQERHRVYGRSGERCLSCGRGRVTSAVVGGRTTSWCGVCQR
jgi:formamidopyrimidine-DNA glycosylase